MLLRFKRQMVCLGLDHKEGIKVWIAICHSTHRRLQEKYLHSTFEEGQPTFKHGVGQLDERLPSLHFVFIDWEMIGHDANILAQSPPKVVGWSEDLEGAAATTNGSSLVSMETHSFRPMTRYSRTQC